MLRHNKVLEYIFSRQILEKWSPKWCELKSFWCGDTTFTCPFSRKYSSFSVFDIFIFPSLKTLSHCLRFLIGFVDFVVVAVCEACDLCVGGLIVWLLFEMAYSTATQPLNVTYWHFGWWRVLYFLFQFCKTFECLSSTVEFWQWDLM